MMPKFGGMLPDATQWQRTVKKEFKIKSAMNLRVLWLFSAFRLVSSAIQSLSQQLQNAMRVACCQNAFRAMQQLSLSLIVALILVIGFGTLPAAASLTDDHFDGNIFPLYAGNGSLVPPKVTLAESFRRKRPALLVFYIDDSSDCKAYVSVVSRLDEFYGWAADFIPVSVDSIIPKATYEPTEPGYYYEGYAPQTVLLDQAGKVRLNAKGNLPFEQVDDVFREVFDLLPRTESVELRRRQLNEVSTELVPESK